MQLDDPHQMIEWLYAAFNARDLDTVLAAMHPEVDWPNGWEGGRVHGPNAVREYWMRQWAAIDPRVDPVGVTVSASGTVDVDVHQTVRDLTGRLLDDRRIRHAYRFENGLVRRMDIHEVDAADARVTE